MAIADVILPIFVRQELVCISFVFYYCITTKYRWELISHLVQETWPIKRPLHHRRQHYWTHNNLGIKIHRKLQLMFIVGGVLDHNHESLYEYGLWSLHEAYVGMFWILQWSAPNKLAKREWCGSMWEWLLSMRKSTAFGKWVRVPSKLRWWRHPLTLIIFLTHLILDDFI